MEYVDPDGRPKMGNARCLTGHPLWLVSEGYAYCTFLSGGFSAWKFSHPHQIGSWGMFELEDGTSAWLANPVFETLDDTLAFIQRDMDGATNPQLSAAPTYYEWLATVS